MNTFKKISIFLGLIAIAFIVRNLFNAGLFKKIVPHEKHKMEVIKGMIGAEDIVIDRGIKKALVSSANRRNVAAGKSPDGAIYLLDYLSSPPKFVDLTIDFGREDFHPHGISLFHDLTDSTKWLFVVNHCKDGHYIEIFQFTDSTLIYTESISHEKIASPNDVVGVGKRKFYFTNDHQSSDEVGGIKDFLMIGTGQVGYFDGSDVDLFDHGLGYANGINISLDGKYIFVATSTGRSVFVYEKEEHKKVGRIKCKTGLDNIELDENGSLWIGCHPKMLAFTNHSKDTSKLSPSQILRIDLNYDDFSKSAIEEIYLNDGTPLSGSTTAAVDGSIILMGTVFEDGVGMSRF